MNQQPHAERPARPPQILLDQFQRPVALAPGFSKLEAVALAVLPTYLSAKLDGMNFTSSTAGGRTVGPIEAAFATAREFCAVLDSMEAKENNVIETT